MSIRVLALSLALAGFGVPAAGWEYQRILQPGDPLPGAGTVVTIADATIDGDLVVVAASGSTGASGLWTSLLGTPAIAPLLVTGDPMPGRSGETVESFASGPAAFTDGEAIAFAAQSNLTEVLYIARNGSFTELAYTGMPMPGGLPGELVDVVLARGIVDGVALGSLVGGSGSIAFVRGTSAGDLQVIASTTTPFPGGLEGETLRMFARAVLLNESEAAFVALGTKGTNAVLRGSSPGTLVHVLDFTAPFPGGSPGETFANVNVGFGSDAGAFALAASGTAGSRAILLVRPDGTVAVIARAGQILRGAEGASPIAGFSDGWTATPTHVYMEAAGEDGDFGIYAGSGGGLSRIAATGDTFDGRTIGAGTVRPGTFATAEGEVVFTAEFGGGVRALYLATPSRRRPLTH